jgi:very-short-patch-repair endonuclease
MSEKKSVVAKHIPPAPLRRGESMKSEVLPYSRVTKPLNRELRKNQTGAEELLWFRIRRKQILGVQFNRQKPIASYIVNFYSLDAKLVIELDGVQHHEPDAVVYDFERTKVLESLGLKVIRFDNYQVFNNLNEVVSAIFYEVQMRVARKNDF